MSQLFDFSQTKIHCSDLYSVITKPKTGTGLSEGAKTFLRKNFFKLKYGKESLWSKKGNKFTNKGKNVEQASIEMIERLDNQLYRKNDIVFENDFIIGTPDIVYSTWSSPDAKPDNYVIDLKNAWDAETFGDHLDMELELSHHWQMQGYLWLVGSDEGEISHTLLSTPEDEILQELYFMSNRMNVISTESPEFRLAEAELRFNMTFDDIPEEERRIKIPVVRDESAIERIKEVVPKCRDYLAELQNLHSS